MEQSIEKYLKMELAELKALASDLGIAYEGMGKTKIAGLVAAKAAEVPEAVEVAEVPVGNSELEQALADYIHAGLRVKIDGETFNFAIGAGHTLKMDSGNLNQPLDTILKCADRLVNG